MMLILINNVNPYPLNISELNQTMDGASSVKNMDIVSYLVKSQLLFLNADEGL